MLIMLAGLPGTGKSRLAQALAAALPATILDKDRLRAALFAAQDIEYATAQDDFCIGIILQVAGYLLQKNPSRILILDGRPFTRAYQREQVRAFAAAHAVPLCLIECRCSDATARLRLAAPLASAHPARNRDYALYLHLKADFEPIQEPHLLLDTDAPFALCLERSLAWMMQCAPRARFTSGGRIHPESCR